MFYLSYFLITNILIILLMKSLTYHFESHLQFGYIKSLNRLSLKTPVLNYKQFNPLLLCLEFLAMTFGIIVIHQSIQFFFIHFSDFAFLKPLATLLFVYPFSIFIGKSVQLVSGLFHQIPVPIHRVPYKSKNLFEFWSLRWNIWIRDWLHSLGKYVLPYSPRLRSFFIFLASGLFHECMVNIPYYLYTGKQYIGYMSLYFFIQYLGISLDKKLVKFPRLRYLLMWITIFAPASFFASPALMETFGF